MAKPSKLQKSSIVIIAVGVIAFSVFATLYLNGSIPKFKRSGEAEEYKNVTLTDAQVVCENYTREEMGKRLKSLSVDDHSTRFDELDNRYKIFMLAELYDSRNRDGIARPYFIHCFSSGNKADIAQFRIYEDEDAKPSPIRKEEKGMFSW